MVYFRSCVHRAVRSARPGPIKRVLLARPEGFMASACLFRSSLLGASKYPGLQMYIPKYVRTICTCFRFRVVVLSQGFLFWVLSADGHLWGWISCAVLPRRALRFLLRRAIVKAFFFPFFFVAVFR